MSAPAASQAAIERALAAAKAQGLSIAGFSVSRDGTIRIDTKAEAAMDTPAANVQPQEPKRWAKR